MDRARVALALGLAALAGAARADEPAVTYAGGALSIRCTNAPLGVVLERVQAATGVALIVEGNGDGTRLTADVPAMPVVEAIPRLLEGTGIGYMLVADPTDASRIAKLYVSASKTAPSAGSPAAPVSPAPPPERRTAAPPEGVPQQLVEAIAEAQAEAEEEDEVSTEPPPVTVEKPATPPGEGFHPVRDPFGRAIPTREGNTAERRGRRGAKRAGQTE